jgi:hypothetical protein
MKMEDSSHYQEAFGVTTLCSYMGTKLGGNGKPAVMANTIFASCVQNLVEIVA